MKKWRDTGEGEGEIGVKRKDKDFTVTCTPMQICNCIMYITYYSGKSLR